jgi:hypothetical protein
MGAAGTQGYSAVAGPRPRERCWRILSNVARFALALMVASGALASTDDTADSVSYIAGGALFGLVVFGVLLLPALAVVIVVAESIADLKHPRLALAGMTLPIYLIVGPALLSDPLGQPAPLLALAAPVALMSLLRIPGPPVSPRAVTLEVLGVATVIAVAWAVAMSAS